MSSTMKKECRKTDTDAGEDAEKTNRSPDLRPPPVVSPTKKSLTHTQSLPCFFFPLDFFSYGRKLAKPEIYYIPQLGAALFQPRVLAVGLTVHTRYRAHVWVARPGRCNYPRPHYPYWALREFLVPGFSAPPPKGTQALKCRFCRVNQENFRAQS